MLYKTLQKFSLIIFLFTIVELIIPCEVSAQSACSEREVQLIITAYQDSIQAIMIGDFNRIFELNQELENNLSLECQRALIQSQQQQLNQYRGGYQGGYQGYRPPQVYDHGGGTYSVPGIGACGPDGCISF